MNKAEFNNYLKELGLTQVEAAMLLSVSSRTVRRWAENPEEIPGPVEQALCAWLNLHHLGLSWRPDSVSFITEDAEQIALHRRHTIDLDSLLQKVKDRGGPAAPWEVDLERNCATLGPLHVSFYSLKSGSFSPSFYHRSDDIPHDIDRDWQLIEDAFACIANAISTYKYRIYHANDKALFPLTKEQVKHEYQNLDTALHLFSKDKKLSYDTKVVDEGVIISLGKFNSQQKADEFVEQFQKWLKEKSSSGFFPAVQKVEA